jgi:hypothetical protein
MACLLTGISLTNLTKECVTCGPAPFRRDEQQYYKKTLCALLENNINGTLRLIV